MVAMVTSFKSLRPDWGTCFVVLFVVSFVVGLSTSGVGDIVVFCSRFGGKVNDTAPQEQEMFAVMKWYNIVTGLVYAAIFLILVFRFVRKAPKSTKSDKKLKILPPSSIILAGVSLAMCVEKFISGSATDSSFNIYHSVFCTNSGLASWSTLMAMSGVLTVLTLSRRHDTNDCLFRGLITVVLTFLLNFSVGMLGELALSCMINEHSAMRHRVSYGEGNGTSFSISYRDENSTSFVDEAGVKSGLDARLMFDVGTTPLLLLTGLVVPVQYLLRKKRIGGREAGLLEQSIDTQ